MKQGCPVLVLALLLSLPIAAMAGPRDDVLEALGKCASVADSQARLACYDGLAPVLKSALATPPERLAGPPTKEEQESWFGFDIGGLFGREESPQTTPEQFGQERVPLTPRQEQTVKTQEIDTITAGVTQYAINPFGKFIVFLDNGQAWQQLQGDAEVAHFHRNPKDNKVTIERAILGSYALLLNDSDKVYKVERLK